MYFGAKNMVLRPFWGAFSRPILRENSAKSPLQVIFCPCIKAVLGVYWGGLRYLSAAVITLTIDVITRRGLPSM